ncbi:hypothetical protein PGLA_18000 [Paenibacillus glacialis]|uniref:Uncharacterized protein n=1 Tax=Paenibacillus glacialis TaxID=494026 RepID=A0A162M9T6_9BACL|nr:hypothetical protein PGLA_18000 [Paenibacillus glacialis]
MRRAGQRRIDFATAVEAIVRPAERKEQLVHDKTIDSRSLSGIAGSRARSGSLQRVSGSKVPITVFGITLALLLDIFVYRLLLRLAAFQNSDKSVDRLEMFVIELVIVNGHVQLILDFEHKLDHFQRIEAYIVV